MSREFRPRRRTTPYMVEYAREVWYVVRRKSDGLHFAASVTVHNEAGILRCASGETIVDGVPRTHPEAMALASQLNSVLEILAS